uniref:Uncharacterized protein n=1 Tax=Apis cerana TaxID=7461 RepID=V9IGG2_APICE
MGKAKDISSDEDITVETNEISPQNDIRNINIKNIKRKKLLMMIMIVLMMLLLKRIKKNI